MNAAAPAQTRGCTAAGSRGGGALQGVRPAAGRRSTRGTRTAPARGWDGPTGSVLRPSWGLASWRLAVGNKMLARTWRLENPGKDLYVRPPVFSGGRFGGAAPPMCRCAGRLYEIVHLAPISRPSAGGLGLGTARGSGERADLAVSTSPEWSESRRGVGTAPQAGSTASAGGGGSGTPGPGAPGGALHGVRGGHCPPRRRYVMASCFSRSRDPGRHS